MSPSQRYVASKVSLQLNPTTMYKVTGNMTNNYTTCSCECHDFRPYIKFHPEAKQQHPDSRTCKTSTLNLPLIGCTRGHTLSLVPKFHSCQTYQILISQSFKGLLSFLAKHT